MHSAAALYVLLIESVHELTISLGLGPIGLFGLSAYVSIPITNLAGTPVCEMSLYCYFLFHCGVDHSNTEHSVHRLLANVNSSSGSLYVVVRPSVVRLSSVCRLSVVCNVRAPYSIRRLKFSAMFFRHLVPWPSLTFV